MSRCTIRVCCAAGAERGRGYAEAVGQSTTTTIGYSYSADPGPQLPERDIEVDERVCWHEASHAVLGFGFGWQIDSVSVVPPEAVRFAAGTRREPMHAIIGSLAGPAGEDERVGWYFDEDEVLVADYIDRVRQLEGGRCDQCLAALNAWHLVGTASRADAAIAKWREGESLARSLLARPHVRAAVGALAARLATDLTFDGVTAAVIISPHLVFGSLSAEGMTSD